MSNLPCFPIFPYLTPLQFRHFSNLPSPTSAGLPSSSPESPTNGSLNSNSSSRGCHATTNTTMSSSPRNSFSIESILSGCTMGSGGSSISTGSGQNRDSDLKSANSINNGSREPCTGSIAGSNPFPHLQFLHHPAFLPNQAAAEFLGELKFCSY